ncbi:hypothetical protein DEI97_006650 [Curtobacterium sp. MCLR17_032]|uniref:hypothetical protein n=1 Tax=Curtobacterium sp. MCLR17_032 TaxID=2175650 RepID=UPI000DA72854|nr:hypothetical protein [Curtobacterium sp. MCLR17_032]WIE62814.1 hypothetical protein DEI97_006650 [Curtobacterium sp. MCLR17_032]
MTRTPAAITIAAAAVVLLAGCTTEHTTAEPRTMTSEQAKQAVVDIVDRSYAEIDGDWTIRSGTAV